MKSSYILCLVVFATLFLTGCFTKKTPDAVVVGSANIASGIVDTGTVAIDTGSKNTLPVVATGMVNTGTIQKDIQENIIDDKDFDPKKSEDKEIDELMQFIEKTVNEK